MEPTQETVICTCVNCGVALAIVLDLELAIGVADVTIWTPPREPVERPIEPTGPPARVDEV